MVVNKECVRQKVELNRQQNHSFDDWQLQNSVQVRLRIEKNGHCLKGSVKKWKTDFLND